MTKLKQLKKEFEKNFIQSEKNLYGLDKVWLNPLWQFIEKAFKEGKKEGYKEGYNFGMEDEYERLKPRLKKSKQP